MSVLPEYRRRVLGRENSKTYFKLRQIFRCNKVVLDVGVENSIALRLYESEGFRVVAQTKSVKIDIRILFVFIEWRKK